VDGFCAVSTLFLTNSVADGGLGFSSADRGVIQGVATFFLYLFPAVFGALADRYGYRRMFLASVTVMAPAYLLLSVPQTFWGFLGVYFLVAAGHGMFKPVVISAVAKTTTEETGSLGFGIFYIFMSIPEYIRDYVDTGDLVTSLAPLSSTVAGIARSIGFDTAAWAPALLENGQIKPEYLINLNAGAIIFFQVLISWIVRKTSPLTSIILGVAVTVASFFIYLVSASGWVIVAAILVFSVGEMLASPRSKEYAGRIAPPDKVGMYMGYFYWCVALGNLFGGLLSGVAYQRFGPSGIDRPNLMWVLFAILAATTAFSLVIYNRVAVPTHETTAR